MANRAKPGARVPVEQLAAIERKLGIYEMTLHCYVTEQPTATERVTYEGWQTRFKLFRPTGPAGGYILAIGQPTGHTTQAPSTAAWLLDDLLEHYRDFPAYAEAMNGLWQARHTAYANDRPAVRR